MVDGKQIHTADGTHDPPLKAVGGRQGMPEKMRQRSSTASETKDAPEKMKPGKQERPGKQEKPGQTKNLRKPRKPKFTVIPGTRYGFLTAIEPTEGRKNGFTVWRCQCDCGREYLAASRELKNKKIPSCKDPACEYYQESLRSGRHAEDYTGRRYGKIVVLGPARVSGDAADAVDASKGAERDIGISQNTVNQNDISWHTVNQNDVSHTSIKQPGTNQTSINQNKIKRTPNGNILWLCKCDCGNYVEATGSELKTGNRKSCGCLSRPPLKDWVGRRFGNLTVTAYDGKRKGVHFWRCICDCGNETVVCQSSLKSGHTTSCGCQAKPVHKYKTLIDGTCVESLRSALMKGTIPKNNKSGVRGVYWDKKHEKWVAQITFKGKTKGLGSFTNIGEARVARKQAEERYFGEFLEAYDAKIDAAAVGSVGAVGVVGSVGVVDAVGAVSALGTGTEADLGAAVDVHSVAGTEAAG